MPIPDTLDSLTLRRDRIQQEFASLGDLRPGSLTRRLQQCGKPGCRCKAEGATGHGPYWSLTFKVQGKTVTRSIPAAAVERTREQIAEHKRFRALAAELVDLSEQLCQARLAEGDDGSGDEEKKNAFATAFIAEIEAEVEALLGRGTSEALDLEAWETAARRCALQVAARVLEEKLNADTSDYRGPWLSCECGRSARYAGRRRKRFTSVLGPLVLERAYYHCVGCESGFYPRDRELGLEGGSLSPGAVRMVGTAAARVSFAESSQLLAELAGLRIDPKRVERAAEALGGGDRRGTSASGSSRNRPRPRRCIWAWTGPECRCAGRKPRAVRASSPTDPPRRREVKLVTLWTAEALDPGRPAEARPGLNQLLGGDRECGRPRYRPRAVGVCPAGGPRGRSAGALEGPGVGSCWATEPPGSGT